MLAYIAQLSVLLLVCAGIFWGLTCASMAVGSNLRNPLKHLVTGALLQVVGFIVVGLLCLIAQRKASKSQKARQVQASYQSAQVDEW